MRKIVEKDFTRWYAREDFVEYCLVVVGLMALIIIPATIGEWAVWDTHSNLSDTTTVIAVILYVLVRIAILAVKILVPFFIVRYIIERFDLGRGLYALFVAIGIIAIVTDGRSYRQYRRENPEFVKNTQAQVDEDAPFYAKPIAKLISYTAGRMVYDLERLTD